MKKLAKKAVAAVLGYQVRRLNGLNDFKVIGVVGSIGKTSTKLAIAQTLSENFRVRYQTGNYNDLVSVPLVFFDERMPTLFNPLVWLGVFMRNSRKLRDYPYDVVVLELGSDAPGQVTQFKKYLNLEIGVVTAITPEHMLTFTGLDAVAHEELTIKEYSSLILANKDLSAMKYLNGLPNLLTYGLKSGDYNLKKDDDYKIRHKAKSEAEQYSLLAAAGVAHKLGMTTEAISAGLTKVQPPVGRMSTLKGLNGSTIIDDTYNSSPAAVKLALDYLYELEAPRKIAVLGNMNELGDFSKQAHQEIGEYCNPKKLDLVLTIGSDANKYTAPSAEASGCKVQTFDSPYAAGDYLKTLLKEGDIVLAKGSQNGVFAEETVKLILADPKDADKLVRQSKDWLKTKQKAFRR